MNAEEQLAYEARVRERHSVIAAVAAILLVAGTVIQLVGPQARVAELTLELITDNKRAGYDIAAAVVNGLGFLALAWTVGFLHQAARARNPERVRAWMAHMAWTGASLATLATVLYAIVVAVKSHQFVTTGAQTYPQGNALLSTPLIGVVQVAALLGIFLLALSVVLVALNSMQQGLLTRFMGYMGVVIGILIVFPVIQIPIFQALWLGGLAYLFSGRWPNGLPPAWSTGRSEPWPPSGQMRAQQAAARKAGGGRGGGQPVPAPQPQPQPATAGAPARTRSSTSKRKRKRRN
jgi:hypothetical protein